MIAAYIITAIAGGVFVVVGALAGDHDSDVDADVDVDMDADMDVDADVDHEAEFGHADVWIPFLSLRFWTYASAFFGTTGLLLTWISPLSILAAALASAGTGTAAGLSVSYMNRYLKQSQTHSGAGERDLVGSEGQVLLPITKGGAGKIRCQIKGSTIDLIAETDDDEALTPGMSVLIIGLAGARARVVRHSLLPDEDGSKIKQLPEKSG